MNEKALEFVFASQQIKRLMQARCIGLMEQCRLRKVELDILLFIAHAQAHQDTAHDIMSAKHISKAHISKSIDNLRQKGYITLFADENDHRLNHLRVTQKAVPVLRKYEEIKRRFMASLLEGFSEEEKNSLSMLLKKMIDNVKRQSEQL